MEANYFYEYLQSFLNENHPDLILSLGTDLEHYINVRVDLAHTTFEKNIKQGIHQDAALEYSLETIKAGLKFSKYNFIEDLMIENYDDYYQKLLDNNTYKDVIIRYVNLFENVFNRYDINDEFIENRALSMELIAGLEEVLETEL